MPLILTNADEGGNLASNYAEFSNSDVTEECLGTMTWGAPYYNETKGKWCVPNVVGYSVSGEYFNAGELDDIPTEDRVSPSKVFWWIYKKIKGAMCPNCIEN